MNNGMEANYCLEDFGLILVRHTQDLSSKSSGECWNQLKMLLFFAYWTGEFAPPTPFGHKNRRSVRIYLVAFYRVFPIRFQLLHADRPAIWSTFEGV